MCGIVGVFTKNKRVDISKRALLKMRDMMSYRGPDDQGLYIQDNIGLGHRRLSIIDLSTGHQPLSNEDDSLWIVFNGEIYNYQALKISLIQKGHVFKSESDTEVIVHLYEELGIDCVHELNGMFAFALWDSNNETLFLARDRMGIKPLYYVSTGDAFMFASEIKAFFRSGLISPERNNNVVFEYFMFRDVSGEETLFKNIYALLPGHVMTVSPTETKKIKYWSPFRQTDHSDLSIDEATEELSALLVDSVKIRMMSEVPLGTFCSGGIDSSLVTAIAAQQVSHAINTFSVGFQEKNYDETNFARMVSNRYGTSHHEIQLDSRQFADFLPQMIWQNDHPLNFSNSIHIYAISKLAKKHVTVVLTGEGADELFGGYPRYMIPDIVTGLSKLPLFLTNSLRLSNSFLSDHRIEKILKFCKGSPYDAILYNSASSDVHYVKQLLKNANHSKLNYRKKCLNEFMNLKTNEEKLSLLDQHTYLVSILYRQDKMSMAASIEARVPFLDYRLVEFANSLPQHFKTNHIRRKIILQKLAADFLPRKIINRKKSGFGVPLALWFRDSEGLGQLMRILIHDNQSDIVDKEALQNLFHEHLFNRFDHSEILWTSINYLLWESIYLN